MADAQMGITRSRHFISSTCCMLHSLHGSAADPSRFIWSSGVTIAALSKNLIHHESSIAMSNGMIGTKVYIYN